MEAMAISWDKVIETLTDFGRSNALKWGWGLLFLIGGWWLGKWRAWSQWRKKDFLGRLNVSLNMICNGRLQIRTIVEKSLEEVLLNALAVRTVRKAAKRTTEANPLLPLPRDDVWYILNAVLNEVAERFSAGEVRRDMGMAVTTQHYLICLTRERAGEVKTQKVRAMLIRKDLLLNLPNEMPQLESPNHETRFRTLQFMAALYKKEPSQFLGMDISL